MMLRCLMCLSDFEHAAAEGRPPSFCGSVCKARSKRDPHRHCRTCGVLKHKTNMAYPAFCSEKCRTMAASKCKECGKQIGEGQFCSGECLSAHSGTRQCQRCGSTVAAPTAGPYITMPRYCTQTCRAAVAHDHGHTSPHVASEAFLYGELLGVQPTPWWHLPVKGTYRPYMIPRDLIPDVTPENSTAKLLNSIAWWNHCIPQIAGWAAKHNMAPELFIAEMGRTGWGGSDTPNGCLPLYEVLPYVTPAALMCFKLQKVLDHWAVASKARRYSDKQIEGRKELVRKWIVEYNNGSDKPMFKPTETGSSKFVRNLIEFVGMHEPPPLIRMYSLPSLARLELEVWVRFRNKLERTRHLHTVAEYAFDPEPHKDRTMEAIERIIDAERARLSRA